MDQCPEFDTTHLETKAMERIVAPGLAGTFGVITTTVKRVACFYTVFGAGTVSKIEITSSGSSSYDTTCPYSVLLASIFV